jgi:plastocyanin
VVGCAGGPSGGPAGASVIKMTSALKYDPAEIVITAGETVHWKNVSIMTHTVTADPAIAKRPGDVSLPPGAEPFNSGRIGPGGSFDHTFSVPGTYKYFCIPHEAMGMVGTVVVNPRSPAQSGSSRSR